MPKEEYSVELTRMLNQLETNKGEPVASTRRIKGLAGKERVIYMDALGVFRKKQMKLFDELTNKD